MRPRRDRHRLQPSARLGQVAVLLPEAPHREGDPDRDRRVGRRDRAVEDGADVVVLELQPIEPAPLVGPGQLGGSLRDERHVPVAMAGADEVGLPVGLEPFRRVLPDRVQEPEAGLAAGGLLDLDQALVDECHQPVEDVAADLGRRTADRLGRREIAPGGEDRQPIEQPLPAVVEQVVAPGDRAAKRLLAFGQVARTGRQDIELVIEPDQDRVGAEQLDAGRRELDRERHPVEPAR